MKTFLCGSAAVLLLMLSLVFQPALVEGGQKLVSETKSRTVERTKVRRAPNVRKVIRSGTERTENCDGTAASSTWVTERVKRRGADDCDAGAKDCSGK